MILTQPPGDRLTKPDGEWMPIFDLPQEDGKPVIVQMLNRTEVFTRIHKSPRGYFTLEGIDILQVRGWKAAKKATAEARSIADAILEERARQIVDLGFTPEHDDCHRAGGLVECALAYANHSRGILTRGMSESAPVFQPSNSPERDLIKAAALLIAEIERRRRLPHPPTPQPASAAA